VSADVTVGDEVIDVRDDHAPKLSGAPSTRQRRGRRPRELTTEDVITVFASAASAICLTWLVLERFSSGASWFGFLVVAYAVFLVMFGVVTADRLGRLVATDRVVTVIVVSASIAVLVPLVVLVVFIIVNGFKALRFSFFLHDQQGITPIMPATAGGGAHAIVGTLEQVGLALLWSLPLGVAAAVFLNESRSKWRRPVRIFVDAMSGLPSIVAGLFIYTTLIVGLHLPRTGFTAAMAISVMMLPIIARAGDVALRVVPGGLREAGLALGSSQWAVVRRVVLPTARPGLATAVILGVARSIGETSPVLLTSGASTYLNFKPFQDPMNSLPLFVFSSVRSGEALYIARGFGAASVLLVLVFVLFVVTRLIARQKVASR
jgi:phosphate transport system permease protein